MSDRLSKSNLNTETIDFQPTKQKIEIISKHKFEPKFRARAHLNIFASKQLITELNGRIIEYFENDLDLYYYVDISTALQINDEQINVFNISIERENKQTTIAIANYDLHAKTDNNANLYATIVPNDDPGKSSCNDEQKWKWKFSQFLSKEEIFNKYGIPSDDLPKSSREMGSFSEQLNQQLIITEDLIENTDWFAIDQIKSAQRKFRKSSRPNIVISFSKAMWITECKKSFTNVKLPLIPIVINRKNKHWIEWVKIIYIESQNISIGIALEYNDNENKCTVKSILLDRGDILNKFRLIGFNKDEAQKYLSQLSNFNTSISKLEWSDRINILDNKVISLKKQIQCQQISIQRLKESLTKLRTAPNDVIQKPEMGLNDAITTFVSAGFGTGFVAIEEKQEENKQQEQDEDWLDLVVDEVIKDYEVEPFVIDIVGAKNNIYVNKQFIKTWISQVHQIFGDEKEMYYWLDYTIAVQMMQKYGKKYINKQDNTFMVAIFNSELTNKENERLYCIILINEASISSSKYDGKYPFKLSSLMTGDEIKRAYDINTKDLPKPSRKHIDFTTALILRRGINERDLRQINWSNVNLYKSITEWISQNDSNNGDMQSINISQSVMINYVKIAIERIQNNQLLPIMVVDKHNNLYGIQWVLIVNIIHRNCYVGVSFEYNKNYDLFIAKGIYLCKQEISIKHRLIGLPYDFSQYLPSFTVKRFKFKAISQLNTNVMDCNKKIMQYKQQLEQERRRNQQLNSEIQRQRQVYSQQRPQLMGQRPIQLMINQNMNGEFHNNYGRPQ